MRFIMTTTNKRRATRTTTNDATITRNDEYNARHDIVRCEKCDALIVDDVVCMNCAHVRDASRVVQMLIDNDARRVHVYA
jgi:ribosomal protein L32